MPSAGTVSYFIPVLLATIAYFNSNLPNTNPKDTPINQLDKVYDFIVIGAGSAGKDFNILN